MFLIKEIYYISMDARGCAAIEQSLRGVLPPLREERLETVVR